MPHAVAPSLTLQQESIMSTPVSISLQSFLTAAEAASSDNKTVKISGHSAKAVGHYTFKSTNHKAMTQFISAIAHEYGSDVANIATRRLRQELDSSRPLTAGLIKSTMTEVQKHSHKQLARDLFLMGMDAATGMASTDTGFSVTFEKACTALENTTGPLSSEIRESLKKKVYDEFTSAYKELTFHSCTQQEMEKFITNLSTVGQLAALATKGVLTHSAGSIEDKIAVMSMLSEHGISQAQGFALQKLGDIRARFPEGPLSMEQIWQGCFGTDMPPVSDDNSAMETAYCNSVARELHIPDSPGARNSCFNLTSVMSLDNIAAFADGGLRNITLDTFFSPPTVSFAPWNLKSGMEALCADAPRVFASMPYPKAMNIPSHKVKPYIQTGSNPAVTIGVTTDKNERNSIHSTIEREVLAECRNNQQQADSVLHLCSQSALSQFFGLGWGIFAGNGGAPFRHLIVNEHYDTWTSIAREENGDVKVTVKIPDNDPSLLEHIGGFSSTIVVHQDGSCEYTDFNLQLTDPQ